MYFHRNGDYQDNKKDKNFKLVKQLLKASLQGGRKIMRLAVISLWVVKSSPHHNGGC